MERRVKAEIGEVGVKLTKEYTQTDIEMFPSVKEAVDSKEGELTASMIGRFAGKTASIGSFISFCYFGASEFFSNEAQRGNSILPIFISAGIFTLGVFVQLTSEESIKNLEEELNEISLEAAVYNAKRLK